MSSNVYKAPYRLALVAALVGVGASILQTLVSTNSIPVSVSTFTYSYMILAFLALVPAIYATAFCIWHLRMRYTGHHPFAWALFLASCVGSYQSVLLPALTYLVVHALPDLRDPRAYTVRETNGADSRPDSAVAPQVSGWFTAFGLTLILLSVAVTVIVIVAHYFVFQSFDARVRSEIGITLTEPVAKVLLFGTTIHTIFILSVGMASLMAALGAFLIHRDSRARSHRAQATSVADTEGHDTKAANKPSAATR